METKPIIGCDIGGVVRDLKTGEAIKGSLEGIAKLTEENYPVIFVSKCGEKMQSKLKEWLKEFKLDSIEANFCLEDTDKAKIIKDKNVKIMIDDKLTILKDLPKEVTKIWFCDEKAKIEGAKNYQSTDFKKVRLAKNWEELLSHIL